jgi:hypothetical protein
MIKKGKQQMKKIITITLLVAMLLCFVSCAELVNTETREVDATVTDVCYKAAWTQMIWSGKVMIPIMHPAKYEVTFAYANATLTVDDKELYDYYKDKIGDTVKCDLIIEYCDDGTIRQTLKLKEEVN